MIMKFEPTVVRSVECECIIFHSVSLLSLYGIGPGCSFKA